MNTADLKEYLSIVVDMEKNIFLQKNLISDFNQELETLKIPRNFVNPKKPSYPSNVKERPSVIYIILGYIGIFFAVFLVTTIFVSICADINNTDSSQYDWLILLVFLLPFVWVLYQVKQIKAANNYQKLAEAEYQKKLKQYEQEVAEIEIKRQQDKVNRDVKTILIKKERAKVENALASSTQHLQAIYDRNVIFPKYRNLVMTCSIYEYICAGRCNELEGHEGAYNILEMEIRFDRIITQLSRIIVQLDAIRQNQFMLFSVIQESNRQSTQLLNATERVTNILNDFHGDIGALNGRIAESQKTSELTAYCAERTQKELSYMNRMDYLSDRNDNVFWNIPPT